jgi:hypothetical protein
VLRCEQKFTITAKAESNLIFVTMSTALRYQRSKMDRKQFLDRIGGDEGSLERPREWLDELLEVSFSLRKDVPIVDLSQFTQPAQTTEPAPAAPAPHSQ